MKIITTQTKNGPIDYGVYERVEEFEKAKELLGVSLISLDDIPYAVPGNYLKSDNGYYVPIVRVRKLTVPIRGVDKGKLRTDLWKVGLPKQELNVEFFKMSGLRKRRVFNYIPEMSSVRKAKFVTPRNKLMIKYVEAGFDLYDAFNVVYPGYKSIHKIDQFLTSILENPNFANYLRKESKLVSLKEEFKKSKVDEEWLASQLKKIIEDGDAASALRIKALEMTMSVLGQKTAPETEINVSASKQGFSAEVINELTIVKKAE